MKERTIEIKNLTIPADRLYFDIETTGLSARSSQIYLIGAIYMQGSQAMFTQWFAESMSDEKEMLSRFDGLCGGYRKLITYNGETFDIPFVRSAMKQYSIQNRMNDMESIDIYGHIRRLRSFFPTEDMTLKSMEKFLGIYREDQFSGGDLIAVYKEYLSSRDERLLHFLLLHNEEDVRSLPTLAELMNYEAVLGGELDDGSVTLSESSYTTISVTSAGIPSQTGANTQASCSATSGSSENPDGGNADFCAPLVTFTARAACPVPAPIIYSGHGFTLELRDETVSVSTPAISGTMKHFFKDYKNYFYLPMEDTAVHKSIGIFTDKSVRQKATPATAYIKKDGTFIPVSRGLTTSEKWGGLPYFYHEYKERIPYILLDTDALKDPSFICDYMHCVIAELGLSHTSGHGKPGSPSCESEQLTMLQAADTGATPSSRALSAR